MGGAEVVVSYVHVQNIPLSDSRLERKKRKKKEKKKGSSRAYSIGRRGKAEREFHFRVYIKTLELVKTLFVPHPPTRHHIPFQLPPAFPQSPKESSDFVLIAKSLRHNHRSNKAPCINNITHPRTYNLHPRSPIRPAHAREIPLGFIVDVLSE